MKVESKHEKRDVARRTADHVYKPMCDCSDARVATFAWEPLPEHSEIPEFVRYHVRREFAPTMWMLSIKDRNRLADELAQTQGDADLPVLDMSCKKWGLANSFRCVKEARPAPCCLFFLCA